MKKTFKILLTFAIALMLCLTSFTALAATVSDQGALDARNGVVKVLVYYNKSNTPSTMGSGFLINDETIITAAHLIEDEDDYKVTKVSVVAVGDIEIEAKKLSVSGERDFAVLKLKQKINKRSVLTLGAPSSFDATSNIYALGFPYVKEVTSDKINYSPTDVVVTGGNVSSISEIDNVKYVQHSAKLDNGNSGGPLVYSSGSTASVVGVNVSSFTHGSSTYYYSIHIDEIIEALDTLGIKYTSYNAAATSQSTTSEEQSQQSSAQGDTNSSFKLSKTAIIAIAVAVALIAIVVVVIVIITNKKNSNSYYSAGRNASSDSLYTGVPGGSGVNVAGGETTTFLNEGDPNATTVLGNNAGNVYLIRVKNNEKIPVTKQLFKIGKDATRVDYCITGNSAISRYHAAIISRDGKYFIEDQGATNHTYVNGQEIPAKSETQLVNGAKIRLANEEFEFKI